MIIRKARPSDWDDIMEIYTRARQFMKEAGNPTQWGDSYPARETLERLDGIGAEIYRTDLYGTIEVKLNS